MRIGNDVEIQIHKVLKKGVQKDETIYSCKLLGYEEKKERMCLILQHAKLTDISLDAIYKCTIWETDSGKYFMGRVKDRYHNPYGAVLEIEIENGFYKINVNSVDKKEIE